MGRRASHIVLVCIALGTPAIGAAAPSEVERPPRPNILFVFADDHAYQAIGAYGSRINRTPNIDRLAREGMRFDRALVTNSICGPSRAVILTGKYSHINGVLDNSTEFDGGQQTFPKLLRQAGYQTAIIGKWHLRSDPTGFDYWQVLPGQGFYYNPDLRVRGGTRRHEGYVTDVITDLALDWLRTERDPDAPFLLMLQHKAPHRNWMPGPDHLSLYDGVTLPEPETLFDDYRHRATPAANQEMEIDRHMALSYDLKVWPVEPGEVPDWAGPAWERRYQRLTEEQRAAWDAVYVPRNEAFRRSAPTGGDLVRYKYQRYLQDYLRTIASIDDNLGRVLDYLDNQGLADDTVVVYSSDQGFFLGEHGWFDKRWIYEESLRTPLIVRWPGEAASGSHSRAIVSNLDLPATFLDVAGVPIPSDLQGRSLVPLLRGETPADWRASFYYHYYESMVAHGVPEHFGVVTERHKLVRFPETDEWELFDRRTDPHELRNVYGSAEYAEVQGELTEELQRLQRELGVLPEYSISSRTGSSSAATATGSMVRGTARQDSQSAPLPARSVGTPPP
jgi:arylsulfatase A-like enzyme